MNTHFSLPANFRLAALACALALGGVLVAAPVPASAADADVLTTQTAEGVPYLNGGIGAAEQAQMHRDARDWPLRLTFSEGKDGAFLADVRIRIVDGAGKTVFTLDDAGPMTYVRLDPGQYRVTADHRGRSLVREVRVSRGNASLYFRW